MRNFFGQFYKYENTWNPEISWISGLSFCLNIKLSNIEKNQTENYPKNMKANEHLLIESKILVEWQVQNWIAQNIDFYRFEHGNC